MDRCSIDLRTPPVSISISILLWASVLGTTGDDDPVVDHEEVVGFGE